MQTLQFGNQSLHFGCWTLLTWLLLAPSAHAQEIIQLPDEDRWLEPNFEEVYRVGSLSAARWRSRSFGMAGWWWGLAGRWSITCLAPTGNSNAGYAGHSRETGRSYGA